MCAQFEFRVTEIQPTGARLGIDRGIVNPVAVAVVGRAGAVQAVLPPSGKGVGDSSDPRRPLLGPFVD